MFHGQTVALPPSKETLGILLTLGYGTSRLLQQRWRQSSLCKVTRHLAVKRTVDHYSLLDFQVMWSCVHCKHSHRCLGVSGITLTPSSRLWTVYLETLVPLTSGKQGCSCVAFAKQYLSTSVRSHWGLSQTLTVGLCLDASLLMTLWNKFTCNMCLPITNLKVCCGQMGLSIRRSYVSLAVWMINLEWFTGKISFIFIFLKLFI